ncbi:MAG: cell envelope integrity EipB family protein [Xanthobacteraceae bacterium]|uniref:cell envelope integrity EipB family protein n=1 Tax=Pseudolabrys sp. TaxID=1960880 RepID=UPI003D0D47DB
MISVQQGARLAAFAVTVAGSLALSGAPSAAPAAKGDALKGDVLAPHRAVYDLKMIKTRGTGRVEAVRGRILYDFSGSACAGYELQFRQVSELSSGEGSVALSDLRSTTWEDTAAKKFRFNSENRLNDRTLESVNGQAERHKSAVAVKLSKPKSKSVSLPAGLVFPTEHMRRIIEAAQAGKSVLELVVYDGSETGEKLYDTLTVIGKKIEPGDKPPDDAAAKEPALAKLARWPVTISYFEKKKDGKHEEQQPVYAISFELYENGISRALVLSYADFTIGGTMTALEMKTPKPCK